ncbi:MAG: hypothetical protein Q9195_001723 [Heterodermia aff. obscurata]
MATATWVIVVSVSISIPTVSLLGYILNRSYRKRRSLTESENDLEADNGRASNSVINEAPRFLRSSEKDVETDHSRSSKPLIKKAPPFLPYSKKAPEADHDRPSNPSTNDSASLYSPERALEILIKYQRDHRNRRPDYGESTLFNTSLSGKTIINRVPSDFFSLPGANPFFSFETIQESGLQTPPPTPFTTTTITDSGTEDYFALRQKGSFTAHEPSGMQSAWPLRRNNVRTEFLQSPRKNLPRAPRKEIGSGDGLQGVEMIPVDARQQQSKNNTKSMQPPRRSRDPPQRPPPGLNPAIVIRPMLPSPSPSSSMAPAIAALIREQRRPSPAVPSMPRPAPRAHVARHAGYAGLSFEDHGREMLRIVIRPVLGLVFLDADDLVAVLLGLVVLELLLGRVTAHLRVVVWRDGDLLVVLLLLLEMGSPTGIFDLKLMVKRELVVRLLVVLFVHLG